MLRATRYDMKESRSFSCCVKHGLPGMSVITEECLKSHPEIPSSPKSSNSKWQRWASVWEIRLFFFLATYTYASNSSAKMQNANYFSGFLKQHNYRFVLRNKWLSCNDTNIRTRINHFPVDFVCKKIGTVWPTCVCVKGLSGFSLYKVKKYANTANMLGTKREI